MDIRWKFKPPGNTTQSSDNALISKYVPLRACCMNSVFVPEIQRTISCLGTADHNLGCILSSPELCIYIYIYTYTYMYVCMYYIGLPRYPIG